MNLRFPLILFFAIATSLSSFGQDSKKEIERLFYEYLQSIIERDFEKSMNYISDDFFKIVPKEQLVLALEKTFNNPEMEFEIKEPRILDIKDSEVIEKKHYAVLTYSNKIEMKFLTNNEETEDEYNTRTSLINNSLGQTFGQENVLFDQENGSFEIYSEKQVYCISDDGLSEWKFIVIEKRQKPILVKILPNVLTDRL